MRRVGVCSWRESLKLVGQLARNHRAAVGQLDGSKQVAALVVAGAYSRTGRSPTSVSPTMHDRLRQVALKQVSAGL